MSRSAAVPKAWSVSDDETGETQDADLEGRIRAVGEEVVRYARLHEAEENLAFLREWECAAENPGGEGR